MKETTLETLNKLYGSKICQNSSEWLDILYKDAVIKSLSYIDFIAHVETYVSFDVLEKKLNYQFKNKEILINALIQSTFGFEFNLIRPHDKSNFSNERLEFLGDSIVNFIVGKNLYKRFSLLPEGDLSKIRGALVNEEILATLASEINLGDFLFLGKGEWLNSGAKKESILADAFEALMASIYLDVNESFTRVEKVFEDVIFIYEKENSVYYNDQVLETYDPKSKLQEATVAKYGIFPEYRATELDPKIGFLVSVWIGEKKILEETGISKKKLEKKLAKTILEKKLF